MLTIGWLSVVDRRGHVHSLGAVTQGTGLPFTPACLARLGLSGGTTTITQPALPAATAPAPTNVNAARQAIEAAYRNVFTATNRAQGAADLEPGPTVSDAALQQLRSGYGDILGKLTVRVDDFRFLSPTQAALRFDLLLNGPPVTATTIGQAVLVNGRWKVARATFCAIIARANVPCG